MTRPNFTPEYLYTPDQPIGGMKSFVVSPLVPDRETMQVYGLFGLREEALAGTADAHLHETLNFAETTLCNPIGVRAWLDVNDWSNKGNEVTLNTRNIGYAIADVRSRLFGLRRSAEIVGVYTSANAPTVELGNPQIRDRGAATGMIHSMLKLMDPNVRLYFDGTRFMSEETQAMFERVMPRLGFELELTVLPSSDRGSDSLREIHIQTGEPPRAGDALEILIEIAPWTEQRVPYPVHGYDLAPKSTEEVVIPLST